MPRQPAAPKLIIYGPDTKYGARRKKTFKDYIYYIMVQDGTPKPVSTGINYGKTLAEQKVNRVRAEEFLLNFLNERADKKAAAIEGILTPKEMLISECLRLYIEGIKLANETASRPTGIERMCDASLSLLTFFAKKTVSQITSELCLAYGRSRKDRRPTASKKLAKSSKPGTVRRELGVLNAAINYCVEAGRLTAGRRAPLPEVPDPHKPFLRRYEAAVLLSCARKLPQAKDYLPDYIGFGLLFGARREAVLTCRLHKNKSAGFVDFESNVIDFQGGRPHIKNKARARPPIPAKSRRKLLSRKKKGQQFVFEHQGRPISDPKKSFRKAALAAARHFYKMSLAAKEAEKLGETIRRLNRKDEPLSRRDCLESALRLREATPHILRHTCITWLLQAGFSPWEVGGYVGDTEETISKVYGHHCPNAMKEIANSRRGHKRDAGEDQTARQRRSA